MTIIYRPASFEDVEAIRRIGSGAFKEESQTEWTIEDAYRFIREARTRLLFDSESAVGFISFGMRSPVLAYITSVAVDPQQQRKGYGKLMLDNVIDELAAIPTIWLDVWERKTIARRLYESRGFAEIENYKGLLRMSRQKSPSR